jgi:two-component sensor histidine kinase
MDAEQGLLIDPNIAVPLGIVLTELVTNAVKYAFPAGRSGVIAVQARRREPQRLEVVIKDDGIGMSPLREGSLGYGLVRSLVEQISGEMHIFGEHGVTVTISFPASSEPPQLQT